MKENLWILRDALDKYYGDAGRYPDRLEELVVKKYLRSLPLDPITDSSTSWLVIPPSDPEKGGVYDVKSGATGMSTNGSPYNDW